MSPPDASPSQEIARTAVTQVPIIDVAPLLRDPGNDAEVSEVARQIGDACRNIGFFYITGHGFAKDELRDVLAMANRFFELPVQAKMTIAARNHPHKLGFIQTGGINPEALKGETPDLKERLFLSRDLDPGEPVTAWSNSGVAQWPAADLLPDFEAVLRPYTARLVQLTRAMLRGFAVSLGLPSHGLDAIHDRMQCSHALNYYPPNQQSVDPTWGFTPHSDYGSFTILLQDDNGGLQAMNAAKTWIDVPPIDGTFVVNIADLLARATNDVYVSTLHRVVNRTTRSRMSLAFFTSPTPEATISVFDTCVSAQRPAQYEPVIAGEYHAALIAQMYRTGKAGVSARTAARLHEEA